MKISKDKIKRQTYVIQGKMAKNASKIKRNVEVTTVYLHMLMDSYRKR